MRRPGRSLRGRFALLATAAVALAVGIACFAAYAVTRSTLIQAVDASLHGPPALAGDATPPPAPRPASSTPRSLQFDVVRLTANGDFAGSFGASSLPVTAADRKIAASGGQRFFDTYDDDGTHVRVSIRHLSTGGAVMVARPLTETDRTLGRLTLLLVIVGTVGAFAAAGLGWLVARTGIAPLDRLTAAAERIARTERAEAPLPVTGSDELARLGRAFNAMVTALAASRERQRHLILDASHELRTPVTVLQTNVELLRRAERHPDRLPPQERAMLLADLDAQAHELGDLVSDVVELAREDDLAVDRATLDLRDPLRRAVQRVKLRAAPTVAFEMSLEPTLVEGDSALLERAFINLLDNAVKFGPPRQTVRVRLRNDTVTIRDEGPGIAARDLPHVFERFYRADDARHLPGSGLGLAIVAHAAELHGASVSAERAPGSGTTMAMCFVRPTRAAGAR
ncbi:MAG: two-component system, OmpR family, sensor histidine kinase MprB [Frankiaceae bacterium]|nr:two-component system, OmpR family, sensor histidine kinase MprB [Frankiaceae bacterium]